jgi:hypothetical protein
LVVRLKTHLACLVGHKLIHQAEMHQGFLARQAHKHKQMLQGCLGGLHQLGCLQLMRLAFLAHRQLFQIQPPHGRQSLLRQLLHHLRIQARMPRGCLVLWQRTRLDYLVVNHQLLLLLSTLRVSSAVLLRSLGMLRNSLAVIQGMMPQVCLAVRLLPALFPMMLQGCLVLRLLPLLQAINHRRLTPQAYLVRIKDPLRMMPRNYLVVGLKIRLGSSVGRHNRRPTSLHRR